MEETLLFVREFLFFFMLGACAIKAIYQAYESRKRIDKKAWSF